MDGIARGREDEFAAQLARGEIVALLQITHLMGGMRQPDSVNCDVSRPTNWLSAFGEDDWQLDDATEQYYYHTFLTSQPDLNWRNPNVREAIKEVMCFWFTNGVDGFRMDASGTS
jgi:glycosidase